MLVVGCEAITGDKFVHKFQYIYSLFHQCIVDNHLQMLQPAQLAKKALVRLLELIACNRHPPFWWDLEDIHIKWSCVHC